MFVLYRFQLPPQPLTIVSFASALFILKGPGQAKAAVAVPVRRGVAVTSVPWASIAAVAGRRIVDVASPDVTTQNPIRTEGRPVGIVRRYLRINRSIPIKTPLANFTMHIINPPGIRQVLTDDRMLLETTS